MTSLNGIFYGLGVGPGDPDLLTIKAVKILNSVDKVFTASASGRERSLARQIAQPHLKSGAEVQNLSFPMTDEKTALNAAWELNGSLIAAELQKGQSVAFLTLGDCLTYSTYAYLLPIINRLAPQAKVISVPGITSYQLAASRLNRPLVMNKENLTIISGGSNDANLKTLIEESDNLVIMKSYRASDQVVKILMEHNLGKNTALCCQLGLEEENIIDGLSGELEEPAPYFSLMLVNKRTKTD